MKDKIKIFTLFLFSFLLSCDAVKIFDEAEALAENRVSSISKKQFRFENGKRILVYSAIYYLDSRGRKISDTSKLYSHEEVTSYTARKYFFGTFNTPDSVQEVWHFPNDTQRNTTIFYYGLFRQLDSSITIRLVNGERKQQGYRFVYSYPQSGIEIEEKYLDNKLKSKTKYEYDEGGKLTSSEISLENNATVKTFNYQYDSEGKKLSLELENTHEKGIQHIYKYLDNQLVKQIAILDSNKDTIYLTTYEYKYRKK